MLASHAAVLDFTALEMITHHQQPEAMSRPERLVAEALHACKEAGIGFGGENALPIGWDGHFDQVVRQLRTGLDRENVHIGSFTFLRCTNELVDTSSDAYKRFVRFIGFMKDLNSFQDEEGGQHRHCPRCVRPAINLPSHVIKRLVAANDRGQQGNSWHALDTVSRRRLSDVVKAMETISGQPTPLHAKVSRQPSRLHLKRQLSLRSGLSKSTTAIKTLS